MNLPLRLVPQPGEPADHPPPAAVGGDPQADPRRPVLVIDCDECCFVDTPRCADCVVTHVLGAGPTRPLVLVGEELDAVRHLSEAGLVPPPRFRARGA